MPQGYERPKLRRRLWRVRIPTQDRQHETHTKPAPQEPQSGLEAETGRALVIALKELGADLLPRHGCGRILVVRLEPGLRLLELGKRKCR
jgi:hypothetical protein